MTKEWYFKVKSAPYGVEEFGGYDSKKEAEKGKARVKIKAKALKDGIRRSYTNPYQR